MLLAVTQKSPAAVEAWRWLAQAQSSLGTIYRARALLAALSSLARLTPLLRDADLEDTLTFYDLVKLMGFSQITISDGRRNSHRVTLQ